MPAFRHNTSALWRIQACAVGRMTISFTSTSAGCSIAKAMARGIATGGIAILSIF